MKPSTAVIGPDEDIVYPDMSRRVDYEAELAVVIGKTGRHVKEEDFRDYVLGYTCINDVTARDLQKKDGQFTRSKSFDTFAPLGPWIETAIADPDNLTVEAYLNGERRQHSNTSNLVFGVASLVSFISRIMTLLPGDVIATGTPSGIGPMRPGDVVEIRVEGIGTLRNRLVAGKVQINGRFFQPAARLDLIPPYLFKAIDDKKAEVKAKGVDIIDLGVGDPDLPTPRSSWKR